MKKNTVWVVASNTSEYGRVYLWYYAGAFKHVVGDKVMYNAELEGYRGTLKKRLEYLGWEIVEVEYHEKK